MVALCSSKEEVIEALKNDIYAKSNVWDFSKVCSVVDDVEVIEKGLMKCRSRFTRSSVRSEIHKDGGAWVLEMACDMQMRKIYVGRSGLKP